MPAAGERTAHTRTRTGLLRRAIRTHREAVARDVARVTRFLDHLAREKRMRDLYSRVDDCHHNARAVVAAAPGLVGAAQRPPLRKARRVHGVQDDALDPETRGFELGQGIRTDL